MLNKFKMNLLLLILLVFFCGGYVRGQGFKGIIPLESTCEDVKRILKIEKCTFPLSVYYLKDFTVSIHYTKETSSEEDKWCFKVPAGTVDSITVSYNKKFSIKEFEYELKYKEKLIDDIDITVYENVEKGINVTSNNGFVGIATFAPTPQQYRKLAYQCKSTCKKKKIYK